MADCIYCKRKIIDGAEFCKYCSHYQIKWKNWIPHIGGTVALIVFFGSLAGYIIKPMRNAYKKITWRDGIEVVSFCSVDGVTIKNSGDGEVFIESVTFKNKKNGSTGAMRVMISANNGKFTTFKKKNRTSGSVIQKGQIFDRNDVVQVFCSDNHTSFRVYKSFLKEEMVIFPCEASLNYYSLVKSEIRSVKIQCVGYLLKKQSANKANAADTKNRAAD